MQLQKEKQNYRIGKHKFENELNKEDILKCNLFKIKSRYRKEKIASKTVKHFYNIKQGPFVKVVSQWISEHVDKHVKRKQTYLLSQSSGKFLEVHKI